MKRKNLTKTKLFIEEDHTFDGAGLGKKYFIRGITFEEKTGRTLHITTWCGCGGYNLREAREAVARIKKTFNWNFV